MEDDEQMKAINESIPLEEDITRAEYEELREQRIRAMLAAAQVTIEDYEKNLAVTERDYEVILQRDINEMMVNNYNPVWMRALNCNHILHCLA